MYDSPRDTGPQLRKFLAILAQHRQQLEEQMAELQANLDEVRTHEKEAGPAGPDRKGEGQGIIDVYVNVNSGRPMDTRASNRRIPDSPSGCAPASRSQAAMRTIGARWPRSPPGAS